MGNTIWGNLKRGDTSALGALYEQYATTLYAYGMKIAQDRELVNDCIQELFVYLYDKRKNLSEPLSVKAYLLVSLKRLIINTTNDNAKKNAQVIRLDDCQADRFDLIIDVRYTLAGTDINEEQLGYLQKAINGLSPQQREILYLRYYKNLSVGEVADIIGIGKQQVMNVSSIALSRLRKDELLKKTVLLMFYLFLQEMA